MDSVVNWNSNGKHSNFYGGPAENAKGCFEIRSSANLFILSLESPYSGRMPLQWPNDVLINQNEVALNAGNTWNHLFGNCRVIT